MSSPGQYCPMLYFAMLLWPVALYMSSLMPSFLSPLHTVNQVLLSLSPKYYQIYSLLSLPASTALVRATATFAWIIAMGSLLPVSCFSNGGHRVQLSSLYTAKCGWPRRLVGLKYRLHSCALVQELCLSGESTFVICIKVPHNPHGYPIW